MRHSANLITSLEGMSRPAYRIARELALNSRSGLTVRFLSKKLELPEEEIEYLIDVSDRLFFFDLTKVKLVAEGAGAIKRISEGLESHGDVISLFRQVKNLAPHDFRLFEEQGGIDAPIGKKALVECFLERRYIHPDSVVEYVATQSFSPLAREVFDLVWQSREGVQPLSLIRSMTGRSEYETEQALSELFHGAALFELFRFDTEDRLLRVASLLTEVRQARDADTATGKRKNRFKPVRETPDQIDARGLELSDRVARLVAAVAARPARLRGDGDLFREDRRRLGEAFIDEEDEASLETCLWIAQGLGWLAQVDNELRVGPLDAMLAMSRVHRHRALFEWVIEHANESGPRRVLSGLLEDLRTGEWYRVTDFIEHALQRAREHERPVLRNSGGHWRYVSPSASITLERGLARSLEETFHWFGVVNRATCDGESVFCVTPLGQALLTGEGIDEAGALYPERPAEIVVQPNFDIVVPVQDVDPLVIIPIEQFCDRTSTGQVTVYRLTKERFTRAMQEGHSGEGFIQFLLDHSNRKGLPDNVMTTLEDWRGGIKHVRIRTIHIIESDDPLVMADLMHRRRLTRYLQPLDPSCTVSFTHIRKGDLVKELEKEGFLVE